MYYRTSMNCRSIPVKTETFLSFEETIPSRKTTKILFNGYQGLLDRACGDRVLSQSSTHRHSMPRLRIQRALSPRTQKSSNIGFQLRA